MAILNQPIREHLAELEERLEARLAEVNQRIASGDNEHFEITRRGRRSAGPCAIPVAVNPSTIPFSMSSRRWTSAARCISSIGTATSEGFEHVLGRYAKQDADDHTLIACLIAWASNMGLGRMGENSDIGYHALSTTSDNFIRLETLKGANDRVSNAIAALPIFRHYDIDGVLHSSSDGQRSKPNAYQCPLFAQYFGLKKGRRLHAAGQPCPHHAEIIGANEHESHYVFDILRNNTTDIQPDVHSTDTHGTNRSIFAILSVFGYQFAPLPRYLRYSPHLAVWLQAPESV